MQKPVTLIKLGGSVITNKEVPMMVRRQVLSRLVAEIARARQQTGELFIIGHGQGSFAHAPAMQFQTMEGFVRGDSVIGMAVTQDSAAQLNRIVVRESLSQQLPAVSFLFSNTLVTRGKEAVSWSGEVLEEYLDKGLLPVTGGDVIVDMEQGCTIWSTEKVLGHIAEQLQYSDSFRAVRIIHVTEVPGVLDKNSGVIPAISHHNLAEVKEAISDTKGFDVTGGMWHKIEESLKQAELGLRTDIISGLETDNLYNCLVGQPYTGTTISHEEIPAFEAFRSLLS